MPGRFARRWAAVFVAVCCAPGERVLAAPPTTVERGQVKQAESALSKAGNLFRAKKYRESGDAANEALELLKSLPADDSSAWESLLGPARKQLSRAKELLAPQGVVIPEWPDTMGAKNG